jgi:hypothetical protein
MLDYFLEEPCEEPEKKCIFCEEECTCLSYPSCGWDAYDLEEIKWQLI